MRARIGVSRAATACAWLAALPAVALAQAAEDIRDIRGPKALSGSWTAPLMLAAALVLALCLYVVRHRRRRMIQQQPRSLSEQTLERLDGTRSLMRPDTARAFGIAASELMRDYIEKRFDLVATQRTTEEFLQALVQSQNEVLARHRLPLGDFLQQCDFVKFAGDSLAVADMEALFHSARRFVQESGEAPVA